MPPAPLLAEIDRHLQAIALCLDHHLKLPALVLIYTGIDIMAALSRPALTRKPGKRHFIAWAETRMNCRDRLGVSGLDLYAARCGIVHTATADSPLSDDGDARRIVYAWGDHGAGQPLALLQKRERRDVVVRIEDLADALRLSVARFAEDIERDPDAAALVRRRSGKLFLDRAAFP